MRRLQMRDHLVRFLGARTERIQHPFPVRQRLSRLLDHLLVVYVPVVRLHALAASTLIIRARIAGTLRVSLPFQPELIIMLSTNGRKPSNPLCSRRSFVPLPCGSSVHVSVVCPQAPPPSHVYTSRFGCSTSRISQSITPLNPGCGFIRN